MNPASESMRIPTVEYRRGIYYLVLDGETPFERGYPQRQRASGGPEP